MIYFETNKGLTSNNIKLLIKKGYRASKSGAVHYFYNPAGEKIITAFSWIELLREIEEIKE